MIKLTKDEEITFMITRLLTKQSLEIVKRRIMYNYDIDSEKFNSLYKLTI